MSIPAQGAEGAETMTAGRRQMAEGCCSAVSPCSHQRRDPYSLCDICLKANGLAERITCATPRTDSDEGTAGDDATRALLNLTDGMWRDAERQVSLLEHHLHRSVSWQPVSEAPSDGTAAWIRYKDGTGITVAYLNPEFVESELPRLADAWAHVKHAPATPPGVPDSVRAALKPFADAAAGWDASENDGHEFADGETIDCGESRLTVGDLRRARTLLSAHPDGQSTDDGTDRCEVCNKPLIAGQRVMQDVELGTVHAACCGPEREAYVKDVETGEPLGPNDPIPHGYVYEGEEPAGQERPDRKWVCNGDPASHPGGQAGDAGEVKPCAWAGGNDTCYCRTCGEEYRYGREDKPACPRKPAPDSTRTGHAEAIQKMEDQRAFCLMKAVEERTDETEVSTEHYAGQALAWKDAIRMLRNAPDSTRTGAAETEESGLLFRIRAAFDSDRIPDKNIALRRAYDALAARPEAPSDAGWSFDMEAAPRDGTVILLWRKEWGEPSAAYWGLAPMADGAGIATKRHPWVFLDSTNGVNGYEDGGHGPMAWHPMLDAPTPPSDPPPSGQAEG